MIGVNLFLSLVLCVCGFSLVAYIFKIKKKRLVPAIEFGTAIGAYFIYLIFYFTLGNFLNIFQLWFSALLISIIISAISFNFLGLDVNLEQDHNQRQNHEKGDFTDLKSPTTYWVFRLALIGFAAGLLTAMSRGTFSFGFLLGFSIFFIVMFSLIGLVIDAFKHKLYKKNGLFTHSYF